MRFFNYTSEFVPWLVETFPLSTFVDIGCGEGHLVQDILNYVAVEGTGGVKVRGYALGVDIRAQHNLDLDGYILQGDATTSRIGSLLQRIDNPVYLFCRPCHSDFVEKTLTNSHPDRAVYIGRASKAQQDLGGWFEKFKQVNAPGLLPAEDGEPLILLTYESEFYVFQDPVELCRTDLRRRGWTPSTDGLFGWVSPFGELVTCAYWQHDLLSLLMGYSPWLFECLGWGRLALRAGEAADDLRLTVCTPEGQLSFDTVTEMQAVVVKCLQDAWEQDPGKVMSQPTTLDTLLGVR